MLKVLYILKPIDMSLPLGVRYKKIIDFLKVETELTVFNIDNGRNVFSKKNFFYPYVNWLNRRFPLLIYLIYKKNIKKYLKRKDYDVVFITVLPYSFLKLPKLIRKFNANSKIIIDLSDPITANMSFDLFSKKEKLKLTSWEFTGLKYTNALIVLNKEIQSYYKELYKNLEVFVIELGINKNFKLIKKNFINEKIILTYAGQLYKEKREAFELYQAVLNCPNDFLLNIYGKFAPSLLPPKTNKIFYGGKVKTEKLLDEYSKSSIIIYIDNKNTIQVPGKTIEILATHKPILFIYYNKNSPSIDFFSNYNGIFYSSNNRTEIKKTILEIVRKGVYFYNRDLSYFHWENILCRLKKVLHE